MRFGRVLFFVIYVTQGLLFLKYLSQLHESREVTLVLIILVPGLALWIGRVILSECHTEKPLIPYLWIVWSLYVSGFTALVVVIFMQDVEKLDKSKFFGPNGLIATLSLLLALLVLLLITEISATESFKLIQRLLMIIAFNFLDGLEMLRLLVIPGPDLAVSRVKKCVTLIPVCLGLMLSAMTLYEHKFDLDHKKVRIRKCAAIFRAVLHICLVDIFSLVLRLLWFANGDIPVIFTAKNVIWIVIGITEIVSVCKVKEEDMSENFVTTSSFSRQIAPSGPSNALQRR